MSRSGGPGSHGLARWKVWRCHGLVRLGSWDIWRCHSVTVWSAERFGGRFGGVTVWSGRRFGGVTVWSARFGLLGGLEVSRRGLLGCLEESRPGPLEGFEVLRSGPPGGLEVSRSGPLAGLAVSGQWGFWSCRFCLVSHRLEGVALRSADVINLTIALFARIISLGLQLPK